MNSKRPFGIILIIIGIILILNINDLITFSIGDIISNYWPLLFVLLGLFSLITNPASKIGGLILISLGIILQLKVLNLLDYKMIWAIVLILIGAYILFFSSRSSVNTNSKDSFTAFALFSRNDTRSISQSFKGGSAAAMFGGINIDLRDSQIEDNEHEAVIDLFTAFGGIDVLVPKGWNVVVKGIPLFGAWSNKVKTNYPDGPTLKINCFVSFGGIEIKN